jgi:hypothetical protein
MFGGGRKAAVDKRAKLLPRMIGLIVHGLQTKSYEQFIASFSNPGSEPNAFDRLSRDHHFKMRILPTCWYDAFASCPLGESPSVLLQGGGDDFGVFIAADTQSAITVDLHLAKGQKAGRDAEATVRSLRAMPGYTSYDEIERSLGIGKQ